MRMVSVCHKSTVMASTLKNNTTSESKQDQKISIRYFNNSLKKNSISISSSSKE